MDEEPRPIGPDVERILAAVLPDDLARRRAEHLREYEDSVREVKDRAVRVYGELVLREIEYLVCCGWPKGEAYLPAVNNLAARKVAIQEELVAEVGRLQGLLRRRLHLLIEEIEDE